MKLVKAVPVLAIVVGLLLFGQSVQRPPAAQAKPTAVLMINWSLCLTLTTTLDWSGDGIVTSTDSTQSFFDCQGGLSEQNKFDNLVGAIRGILDQPVGHRLEEILDNPPTPEDFTAPPPGITPMDSDANQMHESDGRMWVIAFVTNDSPMGFYADEGVFEDSGRSDLFCGPLPSPDYDITDEDCDDDGVKGDGVVVTLLTSAGADRGEAQLRVRQDRLEFDDTYTVVGEPYRVELTASKPVIQTGAVLCELFGDTPSFLATLGAPTKSPLSAVVKDSDGTAITGGLVNFFIEGESEDMAMTAMPLTPTLSSALGISAPNVICGDENTGPITVRAQISKEAAEGIVVDPAASERHAEVEMTVKGPPTAMTMSASPASLACDGTATSAVSANLTDAEGNPAVDGQEVAFSVKALGKVDPLLAKSAGGAATTTLTPLSDILRGVTVDAILMTPELVVDTSGLSEDDIANCAAGEQVAPCPEKSERLIPTDMEQTILVECTSTVPVTPGTPAGGPPPTISPPSTGDGGYLP